MKILEHWLWQRRTSLMAIGGYVLIVLVIMLPWLTPGFILTLDMVFASPMPMPTEVHSGFIFYALLHWVSLFVPADILQKLLLIATLLISGWSGYLLTREVLKLWATSSWALSVAAFAAGLFYMINPFVYSRLMAGQFGLLFAYALLPLALFAFWKLYLKPSLGRAIRLTSLLLALSILSLHIFGMALGALLISFVAFTWSHRHHVKEITQPLLWLGASMAGWVIFSSYWLWPLLSGTGQEANQLTSFTSDQAETFQTLGGAMGALQLQGFWADQHSLYLMPQDLYDSWWLPLIFLLPLVFLGLVVFWKQVRWLGVWITGLLLAAAVLAAGVSDPLFGGMNRWLHDNVPFYGGYRDAQKFVALIAAVYALSFGIGLWQVLSVLKTPARFSVAFIAVTLPIMYTPLLFWGATGQLQPRHYPADWHAARSLLKADHTSYKSLFLPWHLYMPYTFTERTIATPGSAFFGSSVYASTNPEIGSLQYESAHSVAEQITNELIAPRDANNFAKRAAQFDIKYIIIAKSFDYERYQFLRVAEGLKLMQDTDTILLYKNIYWNANNANKR